MCGVSVSPPWSECCPEQLKAAVVCENPAFLCWNWCGTPAFCVRSSCENPAVCVRIGVKTAFCVRIGVKTTFCVGIGVKTPTFCARILCHVWFSVEVEMFLD